jgi:hypothetical protein
MKNGSPDRNISPATEEHISKVRAELPCIRVRPEEVAGAGMFGTRPVCFENAEQAGLWVVEQLRRTAN